MQPFYQRAAQIELHVPQRPAHQANKGRVDKRILQQEQKIDARDPEDFCKRTIAARGERIHDHADGERQERAG